MIIDVNTLLLSYAIILVTAGAMWFIWWRVSRESRQAVAEIKRRNAELAEENQRLLRIITFLELENRVLKSQLE